MPPILKNILAVIAGLVVGSLVNAGIIAAGGTIIPSPAGEDVSTMEGLRSSLHLFEPKHFIPPFLAHALGTLVGAWLAARLSVFRKMSMALLVGFAFLAGGIVNTMMLPAPIWFSILDMTLAYIPMAYLGGWLVTKRM